MFRVSAAWCSPGPKFPATFALPGLVSTGVVRLSERRRILRSRAEGESSPNVVEATAIEEGRERGGRGPPEELAGRGSDSTPTSASPAEASSPAFPSDKDIKKAMQKTAATFAPRASTASKNPAVPGTALYKIFEVQGYASMLLGGALSFNLLFPSNEPDIWRLMGMWSIWMFTIPSLRARDCSKSEKEALNYLFLLVPLINVIIPFFWKSFAVVWSADTLAFLLMYSWKLGWFQNSD